MAGACPRLRALEIFSALADGRTVACIRDPSGLSDRVAFVPPFVVGLLSLCDGRRDADEVARALAARTGVTVTTEQVDALLEQLDEALLLESPRFRAHRRAVIEAYRAAPVRAAAHAGRSYPERPDALRGALEAAVGPVERDGAAMPDAIVAPHIDFPRGGPVYAAAYRPLLASADRPDLVVIFGTDHNGAEHPFTLTRKGFATPLGDLETDAGLVEDLARAVGGDWLFADELHHRAEHSIEFQAVWLRHAYGEHAPPILPVLCGSLQASVAGGRSPLGDARVRAFCDALRAATAGRRTLLVAGADLSHVGPRFGDEEGLGPEALRRLEEADGAALAYAARADADGFFAAVAADGDRRRVCGLAPIFATLACLQDRPRSGQVLAYAQPAADDDGTSVVSIAALVLR